MIAEEGRSRKQHMLSALSHVSRWERNKVEAQQISSRSLHSRGPSPSSRGGFFSFCSLQDEKQHLHSLDSNKNTITHCSP